MTDELNTQAESGESFAEMFEQSEQNSAEELKVGDKVRGRIISITENSVFVDAGAKLDAVVDPGELRNAAGELPYKEGDELELYVVAAGPEGLKLSTAVSGEGGSEALRQAFEAKVPVEGKVRAVNKGGFEVRIMGKRAFCPMSQMELGFVEDPAPYLNQVFSFLIIKFENNGRNIVVSRREILDRERQESTEKFLQEVQPGQVLEGTVRSLTPYGAFVDLFPGLSGLVHVSELSWERVADPAQAVEPGQTIAVKVLAVEPGKKKGQLKISLSAKQAQADPWTTIEGRFAVGDKVPGKVVRLADFGAFVAIAPGIEGLVHVSELSYTRRVSKPGDILSVGQDVEVAVKDIDLGHRRIGLSLREVGGDPWAAAEDKYAKGATVTGTVEKREQFGLFVNLEPGVTGLLPKSKMARAKDPAALEALKPGDSVTLVVEDISLKDRKVTLGPVDAREAEDTEWKKFASPRKPASGREGGRGAGKGGRGGEPFSGSFGPGADGLGLLGDKLREAMERRK